MKYSEHFCSVHTQKFLLQAIIVFPGVNASDTQGAHEKCLRKDAILK